MVLRIVKTSQVICFTWNFLKSKLGARALDTFPLGSNHQGLLSGRCLLGLRELSCALVLTTPCCLLQPTQFILSLWSPEILEFATPRPQVLMGEEVKLEGYEYIKVMIRGNSRARSQRLCFSSIIHSF